MSTVKGVVLCGGPGTRLRPLSYYFQKAMIPIGKMQKPLLEYIVRLLKFYGINNIVLLVDYKAEQIINYFGDGSRFDVNMIYVYDDPSLKGTAGSIINAYRKGAVNANETLLIYYGDILTNMNIKDFLNYHKGKRADITVALASGFTVKVGVAEMGEDGRITYFQEKPKIEKPVSIAIALLEGFLLEEINRMIGDKRALDFMGDVVPHLIETGRNVYGYLTGSFWYDVGSIEAYEKLDSDLVEKIFAFLYERS
ncbi:MAG: nucleotidyltransferase family protein [Candidatus Bathyarchaeia archaeon]